MVTSALYFEARRVGRSLVLSRERLNFGSSFVGAAKGLEGVGGFFGFLGKGGDAVEALSEQGTQAKGLVRVGTQDYK